MNKISNFVLATTMLAGAPMTAQTILQDAPETVQAQANAIEAQGYRVTEWHRSFLGRYVVEFDSTTDRGVEREVVLNGNTGEVMRDYVERDNSDEDRAGERDRDSDNRGRNDDEHNDWRDRDHNDDDDRDNDHDDDDDDRDDDHDDRDDDND